MGCSPRGHKELDTAEQLSAHAQAPKWHPSEWNEQTVCVRLSFPSPSSVPKPGKWSTSQAIEQKTAAEAQIPIRQAKVARQTSHYRFPILSHRCKDGKEHKQTHRTCVFPV